MNKKDELITQPETALQGEAEMLIAKAIDKNVPVETMERLLAMRDKLRAEKAEQEFDRAMANFQAKCPTIEKRKQGYNYKYADLTDIVEQVKGLLAENGFSYTFDTEEAENAVIVYCQIKHIGGHKQTSKAEIKRETTSKMNASQQSGASMTYGKRYAFINALGILTGDEDTDAALTGEHGTTEEMRHASPVREQLPLGLLITSNQLELIKSQLTRLGKSEAWLNHGLQARYNVADMTKLDRKVASVVIKGLLAMSETQAEEDKLSDEVAEGMEK